MNFDTPLVEYLIIGTHTSAWFSLLWLKLLKLPMSTLLRVDATTLLLLLPFIYIFGMIFDDITFRLLSPRILKIKRNVFGSKSYKDENIAHKSATLYNAYEARVRRVRIIGAAILNWPLLGFALLINVGPGNLIVIPIIVTTIVLTILSWYIWHGLNNRAYKFRKNAIDVIEKITDDIKTSK